MILWWRLFLRQESSVINCRRRGLLVVPSRVGRFEVTNGVETQVCLFARATPELTRESNSKHRRSHGIPSLRRDLAAANDDFAKFKARRRISHKQKHYLKAPGEQNWTRQRQSTSIYSSRLV